MGIHEQNVLAHLSAPGDHGTESWNALAPSPQRGLWPLRARDIAYYSSSVRRRRSSSLLNPGIPYSTLYRETGFLEESYSEFRVSSKREAAASIHRSARVIVNEGLCDLENTGFVGVVGEYMCCRPRADMLWFRTTPVHLRTNDLGEM
jgi:hypothetical protein